MSPFTCKRDREVSELLHNGYWPKACPEDLRAHVESCRSCSDLILVTETLHASRKQSAELPHLEPPGAIWWRAQLRRRNAALETMSRPILGAQIFALIMAVFVIAGVAISQAGNWSAWFADLPSVLHLDALIPSSMAASSTLSIVVPLLATIALLSGVVVYLASDKQ
ncbi:MAG TPA: hypothetical protein VFE01_05700 [Terracidiphilus sp.]|jgi:hypothetical protein|nr:hypothetical protein [Terracidiphilus sp.]